MRLQNVSITAAPTAAWQSGHLSASNTIGPMVELAGVQWPVTPIRTRRLVLREARAEDRSTFLDLFSSPQVYAFLGGARPRDELAREMPSIPARRAGAFVVERHGGMIGLVTFDRRDVDRPGRASSAGGDVELSYELLPAAWGHGYATEACEAALRWASTALPGEPVVLCTQEKNIASRRVASKLGFLEADRFEEFGERQWFGVRHAN
jgi:RimJ/RimL family protein N-acetyltransferase